jgi:hypothetical protein
MTGLQIALISGEADRAFRTEAGRTAQQSKHDRYNAYTKLEPTKGAQPTDTQLLCVNSMAKIRHYSLHARALTNFNKVRSNPLYSTKS